MAEGWAKHLSTKLSTKHDFQSAGIEAHGLNQNAVDVMREAQVDISGQFSTRLEDVNLAGFDVVVTVCGDADEKCPVLDSSVKKIHWPLSDPARLRGSQALIHEGFCESRDEIRRLVVDLLTGLPD
jgi:arsenate reductase